MTTVRPQIFSVETVLEVEKMSDPEQLFVTDSEKNPECVVLGLSDDNATEKRKMTIEEGLRPLLASMRLFGLYFSRPPEAAGCDAEKKSRKWSACSVYALAVVVLLWINAIRMLSVFTLEDEFGVSLLNKVVQVIWSVQCTVSQTAIYMACYTGRLAAVLSQALEQECAGHSRKFSVAYAVMAWSVVVLSMTFFAHGFFVGDYKEGWLAPFQSHILVSDTLILRILVYFIFLYLATEYVFSQFIIFVLAMMLAHKFRKITHALGCCLDNHVRRQVSDLDIEILRQKHQEISMTVSRVDDCLMFSNASAFCCQVASLIVVLYNLTFYYHSLASEPLIFTSYIFWMFIMSVGLLLTAGGGITLHHYVSVPTLLLFLVKLSRPSHYKHTHTQQLGGLPFTVFARSL